MSQAAEAAEARGARILRSAIAGAIGPVGFLATSFTMALVRPDVIRAQGWASWPSSMALGGPIGVGQTLAFLWLAGCYAVFALGALRPALGDGLATGGFLAVAAGDVLLAFPTDPAGVPITWHGTIHVAGVLLATLATIAATFGVTRATRTRADWRSWRRIAWVPIAAAAVGPIAASGVGAAKVVFVVGVTLPAAMVAWLVYRDTARALAT